MLKKQFFLFLFTFVFTFYNVYSQDDLKVKADTTLIKKSLDYEPLRPATAAFYSAVLPGLGQAYNKKYWKIPIIYGALGTSIGIYIWNNNRYNDVRDAYKLRINGKDDEYFYLSESALISAQETFKQNRDLTLFITLGLYALQIIEASVNAHLLQHNVDDNLSFKPQLIHDASTNKTVFGASINYSF